MANANPTLDPAFTNRTSWGKEFTALRAILLDSPLSEERKWGKPCYCYEGGNVAILYSLKAYCGLGFFKGALLADPAGVLHQQGAHSQAVRLFRFADVAGIERQESVLRAYIAEAIELERSGQKIDFKEKHVLIFSEELQRMFHENPDFEAAFNALTPGRQRAYNLHFSGAKHAATRQARIERSVQDIMAGKGWNERPRR